MANNSRWRSAETRNGVLKALSEHREVILFDTETTGLKADTDRVIEIAAIKFAIDDNNTLQETGRLHRYIRPPFLISQTIIDLTGITNEQLQVCPYEEELFEEIHSFFSDAPAIVAAYNTPFDMRFLKAMYQRNTGRAVAPIYELDTLEMARDLVKPTDTENYKLGTLAAIFGLDEGVVFHSAIEDVQVTAKLFELFYKEYLEMGCSVETGLKLRPDIQSIGFWEGFRGFSRIYVQTALGSVYYDIRRKSWYEKDVEMDDLDMTYIESEALRLTESKDLKQFANFKGRIKV